MIFSFTIKSILKFQLFFWDKCISLLEKIAKVEITCQYESWTKYTSANKMKGLYNDFPFHSEVKMMAGFYR